MSCAQFCAVNVKKRVENLHPEDKGFIFVISK